MKHTPSPWKLAGATTISNADHTSCIDHISTYSIEQSEAAANAALIAAAPELLALLQESTYFMDFDKGSAYVSVSYMEKQNELHSRIVAAIAKAGGTTL